MVPGIYEGRKTWVSKVRGGKVEGMRGDEKTETYEA